VIGPDRQLAVAPVDEDREANGARPPELAQRVEGGPYGPARVQHVVDEDDRLALDLEGQVGALDDRRFTEPGEVVAVEGDIERPDRQPFALVLGDRIRQSVGQRHAAALDADEHELGRPGVLLDDLVRDPHDRPADVVRGHDSAAAHRTPPGLTGPATGSLGRP
jgi:hypothetical protein